MKKIIIKSFVLAIVFLGVIKCTDDPIPPTPTCEPITEICFGFRENDTINHFQFNWYSADSSFATGTSFEVTLINYDADTIIYQTTTSNNYLILPYIPALIADSSNIQLVSMPCNDTLISGIKYDLFLNQYIQCWNP